MSEEEKVDEGYSQIYKLISKMEDSVLKSVIEMCQTYTKARLGIGNFFIMEESKKILH